MTRQRNSKFGHLIFGRGDIRRSLRNKNSEIENIDCKVVPIRTIDYPTLAKRPQYSVLDKSKIKSDFKLKIPHWRDSLEDCIKKINTNS